MAARASMATLISRVRLMINDPVSDNQAFSDDDIQSVMDETRLDVRYLSLIPRPTYVGASLLYLDYYAPIGGYEDDATLWQYRITQVTPTLSEPIVGHYAFAQTTLPPVYIIGKVYDVYRTAADLLERFSMRFTVGTFDVSFSGQSYRQSQQFTMLQDRIRDYRRKQRTFAQSFHRDDIAGERDDFSRTSLGAKELDYMASGDGR